LLSMQEELKQARKAFEVDEEKLASTEWHGIGIVDG
jgi:transcription initiation factor TFIID subunit 13